MGQTVFMVTSGCYSDYHVDGIFSTRELAERYLAEMLKYDDTGDVREVTLDEHAGEVYGEIFHAQICKESGVVNQYGPSKGVRHESKSEILDNHDVFTIYSPISQEHAAKVAAETRQAYLRERSMAGYES